MATKRTITVELLGHRFLVRTTEPEEAVQEDRKRVEETLSTIRERTGIVDTLELFALGLLHLGRELRMQEEKHNRFLEEIENRIREITGRVHQVLSTH